MPSLRMIHVSAMSDVDRATERFSFRCVPIAALYVQSLKLDTVQVPAGSTFIRVHGSARVAPGEFDFPHLPPPGFGIPVQLKFGSDSVDLPVAEDAPLSEVAEWFLEPLLYLARKAGWEQRPFVAARDYALERVSSGFLDSTRKRSPDQRKYAELAWLFDATGAMRLNLTVTDRQDAVLAEVTHPLQAPFAFQTNDWRGAVRRFAWTSKTVVGVGELIAQRPGHLEASVP